MLRNYSVYLIGLFYNKFNEGVLYEDGIFGKDKDDDEIRLNGMFIYKWIIFEEMGFRDIDV